MKFGAVSSGHQLTSETAMSILRSGGNAFDAAIGAYATACVAEPCMASLAAGAFATIYQDGQVDVLDCFCKTPGHKNPDSNLVPIYVDFGTAQEVYYGGHGAIAIPGVLKGLFELHQRFGTMPMSELLEPARIHALEGVALTPFQHLDLTLLRSIFGWQDRGRQIYFDDSGDLHPIGSKVRMEYLADFLGVLGKEGERLFYEGEVAQMIAEGCQTHGGHIRREDMAAYNVHWRRSQNFIRQNHLIHMPPGPSMGHAMYMRMNGRLEMNQLPETPFSNEHLEYLLPGLHGCRDLLNYRQLLFELAGVNVQNGGKMTGTSHLNVLDAQGNAITMTFSIGEGSGVILDGTDIHLNNMLGEPALLPNGLNSWAPDRRLASMMSPTIIMGPNGLKYLLGTGGAERIPIMLAEVIHYMLDLDLDLATAIQSPRVYLASEQLEVEAGFERGKIIESLPTRYWEEASLYFGGVHGIAIDGLDVQAVGDDRREGFGIVN